MKANLKRRQQITSQVLWVSNLNIFGSSGIMLFPYSCIAVDEGSIRLVLQHKELPEMLSPSEAMPFRYEDEFSRNEIYNKYFESWKN